MRGKKKKTPSNSRNMACTKKDTKFSFLFLCRKKRRTGSEKKRGERKNRTSVLPLPRGLSTTLRFCLLLPTPIISLYFAKSDVSTLIAKLLNAKHARLARPPLCATMRSSSHLCRASKCFPTDGKHPGSAKVCKSVVVCSPFKFLSRLLLSMFHSLGCVFFPSVFHLDVSFFFYPYLAWMCFFFPVHVDKGFFFW